ncbi:hypothetical protein FPOAC1_008189 [Fusarium poae]|uniref:hypothetical protein n=1 Tax=Fusarium poae TaxID=36050 RepID=UPI001CE7D15C|nr:hypothetical protein FPOAC1_008189 [Fusarium poae]KAG8668805.1 hypothetical protein FPOAC1_008189 [Fusarium poae]
MLISFHDKHGTKDFSTFTTKILGKKIFAKSCVDQHAVERAGYRLHRLQYQGSFTSETLALQVISLASAARPETLSHVQGCDSTCLPGSAKQVESVRAGPTNHT